MTKRQELGVVIQALKKAVAFQDDLVKKLAGVPLIERAIGKAKTMAKSDRSVYVLTDSEEIELIAIRNGTSVFYDSKMTGEILSMNNEVKYLENIAIENEYLVVLSPYAPFLMLETILKAHATLKKSGCNALRPLISMKAIVENGDYDPTVATLFQPTKKNYIVKPSGAFVIVKAEILLREPDYSLDVMKWQTEDELFEIESYHDWWVAEKVLKRKRIVFRVIGNETVGMGHIYRALTLAHAITDHEVLFVCESGDRNAVDKLAGYDYWFESYDSDEILEKVIKLKPDLVINDMLSTSAHDIRELKKHAIHVINFEDLGSGATESDLTINELYDVPQISGDKIVWGHDYFFVRDEFNDATPVPYKDTVTGLLLTFGGTDHINLTRKIFETVYKFCINNNIFIYIVTGPGYKDYDQLSLDIKGMKNVSITHDTGVISSLMEKVQLAITSNGRTVYELAHMNIPAIVVSQHERENTHLFSTRDNGFLNVGVYDGQGKEKVVQSELEQLVTKNGYRKKLYEKMEPYNFDANKTKILTLVDEILDR
ncbi:MAG: hypothetical protein CL402_03755 [Acidiferrobacteraceae bacterium]|nr:hypothetical protein [Acidiferrobacteraceae bacterium]|tara:strand:- start:31590 stop:33215 length:1626 start_codon:yes stop_codon:yes gene_type:complete